jgi:hypothetical protein
MALAAAPKLIEFLAPACTQRCAGEEESGVKVSVLCCMFWRLPLPIEQMRQVGFVFIRSVAALYPDVIVVSQRKRPAIPGQKQ